MIASTKLARAQKYMESAKAFGGSVQHFSKMIEAKAGGGDKAKNILIVCCSSDRGLCGAIHSSISKMTKKFIRENPETQVSLIVLGDKAKAQLARDATRKNIAISVNQIGKAVPTLSESVVITQKITELQKTLGKDFDQILIGYNKFKTVISYETGFLPSYSLSAIQTAPKVDTYELEGDNLIENYYQFSLASSIYWALSESHASENAARRTAMDNATRNAGDIIIDLTMKFNRTRQAVITNELCDIITGASAL